MIVKIAGALALYAVAVSAVPLKKPARDVDLAEVSDLSESDAAKDIFLDQPIVEDEVLAQDSL